ncbi:MAG: M48 family metalloprotease [Gemmatimonadota bacterium]|nr:M48 family metalloprotease [Gemmatimonadota bacterium]
MQRTKVFGLMAVMTAMFVVVGGVFGGRGGALTFFLFAAVMNFGMYWFSDRMVLRMYRARTVGPEDAPELYAMVDRLRQRASLPMPTLAIAPQQQPNAFATGRNPEHAVVCCTTGLLELMSEPEIEGVLAHELAHIKHRHMLTGTVAATMSGAIASLARWGFLLSRGDDRNPVVGIAMMIIAPIAAFIIQMAISRQNEFQADRTAAEIVGRPDGLMQALERLDMASRRIPMDVNPAAAQLAIVNPLAGVRGGGFMKLFSTHPPTAERIAALRALR